MKYKVFTHGKLFLRYLIPSLILAGFLGISFGLKLLLEPVFFILAAVILSLGFSYMRQASYIETKKKHYLHFLAYLSGRLNMGVSLERALYESLEPLSRELGQHQQIIRALKSLRTNMEAQMTLNDVLQLFAEQMKLRVCSEDMRLLSLLAGAGGKVEEFVKQRQRALSTQMSIQADIVTEYKGKSTETVLLALMPFLMAFLFLQKNVQSSSTTIPALWRGMLYLLSVFAVFLVMWIVSWREPGQELRRAKKKLRISRSVQSRAKEASLWGKIMTRFYLNVMPANISLRITEAMTTVSDNGEVFWPKYFHDKKLALALGLLLLLLSRFLETAFFPVGIFIFILPWIVHDLALLAKARDTRSSYSYYAPGTISTLEILLISDLTLERSLQIMGKTAGMNDGGEEVLQRDIRQAVALLNKGYSGPDAAYFLAERCPLTEIQSALQLMARYSQQGSRELLELLGLQTQHIWQIFRHAQRNALERRMMRLIIPMAVDLFTIIATIALPFISEFGSLL